MPVLTLEINSQLISIILYIKNADFVSSNLDGRISFTLLLIRSGMREDASTVSEIQPL